MAFMRPSRGASGSKFIPRLDETSRSRVHVFNSFFLKKLKETIEKGLDMRSNDTRINGRAGRRVGARAVRGAARRAAEDQGHRGVHLREVLQAA